MTELSDEQLNEWLAVNMMGWAECDPKRTDYIGCWHQRGEPDFAGDIAAAFQVVERMRERGIWIDILPRSFGYRIVCVDSNKSQMDGATATTLDDVPKKICEAAKQALEKTQ